MSYLITARKWRPQNFDEVLGQKHVTLTLKNAILKKKISQSYLFSGPRGVGKTTMSRIFAKALNCTDGPTEKPCNACNFCQEVHLNTSINYKEIDGASNRGINQIRELNESLQYSSPEGKYRIFVIDEVHMLTIEAFNALLKSLEEPPSKVIFIFCTTESHKVPVTIRSRCQHYAFKRFDIKTLEGQLKTILAAEKITYDKETLFHIAQGGNGSMRDAQNILDQVIAYCEGHLSEKKTIALLGKTELEIKKKFIHSLFENKITHTKQIVSALLEEGKDIELFLYELIECFSTLLYLKEGLDDPNLLEISEEHIVFLKEIKDSFEAEQLFLLNDICFEFLKELKTTISEKIMIQFFLIKLHRYRTLITPEQLKIDLLAFAKNLEKQEELLSKEDINDFIDEIVKQNPSMKDLRQNILLKDFSKETLTFSTIKNKLNEKIWKQFKNLLFDKIKKKGNDTINKILLKENPVKSSAKQAAEIFNGSITEE